MNSSQSELRQESGRVETFVAVSNILPMNLVQLFVSTIREVVKKSGYFHYMTVWCTHSLGT